MSFWQFMWQINPSKLKCNHCKKTFSLTGVGKHLLITMVIIAFILGFGVALLSEKVPLVISIPALFIVLSIIGAPLEYYLWKYARYEKKVATSSK